MSGRFRVACLIPFVASISLAAAAPAPSAASPRAVPASEGVSTENRQATRAAMAVLAGGGNAVDAAVTAALVAGVTSPRSSGLGGGGFALVYLAAERATKVLDFREIAPRAIDAAGFERRPFPEPERGKLVGVPGEPAGLSELHRRFGKLPWRDVVAPAERLAKNGFAVEAHLAEVLTGPASSSSSAALLRRDPGLASVYFPAGRPALSGQRITNPRLARTLGRLKNEGPRAIYAGEIASDLVASARGLGSSLSLEDLAAFQVSERTPLVTRWEGYEVQTVPPPSAGGLMLAQVLGMFSHRELEVLGTSTLGVHLLAEAMRSSSADRSCCIGDPAFVAVDVPKLLSPAYLAQKKRLLSTDRTHLVRRFVESLHGTHHLVAADRAGNVVALTTTVNSSFGADVAAEKSGIVLNDELDDFTSNVDAAKLGVKDNPNRPRPAAKPVSSMTPAIVFRDGRPVLAIGGSGGTTIPQNVLQVMVSVLVRGVAGQAAVSERRFSLTARDATLVVEPEFTEAERADLVWRGEILRSSQRVPLAVQLLAWGERGLEGGADPRKQGLAEVR